MRKKSIVIAFLISIVPTSTYLLHSNKDLTGTATEPGQALPQGDGQPSDDNAGRKCGPPLFGETHYRRNIQHHLIINDTLWKRMKLPEEGNMAQYMIDETGSDSLDNYPIVWDRSQGRDQPRADFNTATLLEYSKYFIRDKKEFSLSTGGLKGCTVLAIISRRAVYIAHYWESIAFAPDEEDLERYQTVEKMFQLFVEKGLRQGIGKGSNFQQHSLERNAQYIDDEYIQAYLLIPSDTYDKDPRGYPELWSKLKSIVGEILPRLKITDGEQNERWHEIKYDRVTRAEELNGHRGRCLFKFDPQHPDTERNKKVKKAMFWNEDNPVAHHSDEWD